MANTKKFYMHKISNLINIQKIVTIHYQELSKGYSAMLESHNFWELIYVDKNEAIVEIDGVEFNVKRGELFVISPNASHTVKTNDNEPNIFIISFDCRSESMHFFANKKMVLNQKYHYLLKNIMQEATNTFIVPDFNPNLNKLNLLQNANLGGEQALKNSLELLLIYLLRDEAQSNKQEKYFVTKTNSIKDLEFEIANYLSNNLYGKFSLDGLCDSLYYGKTFLCSFFKQKTGKTIYQTYLKFKVDEAKKLIRNGIPLQEIAEKLCFDSPSHFNSVFKKYAKVTPNEYKLSITTR
ncbi:MAG: helix-turn-helix domain-containing protein [Clostridia bacterium]|nr:helix-turn-helix domain-containing protein [Clostridia bacterium]